MKWNKIEDLLPPEGRYVLVKHNKSNFISGSDQEGVQYAVCKIYIGISKSDREKLNTEDDRKKIYKSEDEAFNNLRPYYFSAFGPMKYFGQEITHWMEIERI